MKLCNRSSQSVTLALRILANTIPQGSHAEPPSSTTASRLRKTSPTGPTAFSSEKSMIDYTCICVGKSPFLFVPQPSLSESIEQQHF